MRGFVGERIMYHYKGTGLDNVYLTNGYKEVKFGDEVAVSVSHVKELHKAIAKQVFSQSSRLSGKEIRFLRNEIGMSQAAFAELINVKVQTFANWEKGTHKVQGAADRLMRLYVKDHFTNRASRVGELLKEYAELTNHLEERMYFQETEGGWAEAA